MSTAGKETSDSGFKPIAQNKRVRFDYFILETFEAGIALTGGEVKSLRLGRISLNEAYAGEMASSPLELFLYNLTVPDYAFSHHVLKDSKRPKKLLLKRRQINKILSNIRKKGMTLIAMSLYFNHKGKIKVGLGLGKGKNTVDKRQTIADRDWKREQARTLRNNQKD